MLDHPCDAKHVAPGVESQDGCAAIAVYAVALEGPEITMYGLAGYPYAGARKVLPLRQDAVATRRLFVSRLVPREMRKRNG